MSAHTAFGSECFVLVIRIVAVSCERASPLFLNVSFLWFTLLLYRVSARIALVSGCLVLVIHTVAVLCGSFGDVALHAANT